MNTQNKKNIQPHCPAESIILWKKHVFESCIFSLLLVSFYQVVYIIFITRNLLVSKRWAFTMYNMPQNIAAFNAIPFIHVVFFSFIKYFQLSIRLLHIYNYKCALGSKIQHVLHNAVPPLNKYVAWKTCCCRHGCPQKLRWYWCLPLLNIPYFL